MEIRPDAANAWSVLAQLLYAQGKFDEAAASAERAFDADAFFEVRRTVAIAMTSSLYAQRFDDARRWCRFGLEHYGASPDPRFKECELTILGWTGRSRSDVGTAWRLLNEIERRDTLGALAPTWTGRRLMVSAVLARSGMRDSGRAVLTSVQATVRRDATKRSAPVFEAYVRLLLNERDSALVHLTDYLRSTPQARAQIGQHPWFRPLKGDPRFEALVGPVR